MNLYIIRHAIAVEPGAPGYEADSQRPLTDKGSEKMFSIARGLKALETDDVLVLFAAASWAAGNLARLGLLDSFDCLRCAGDVARAKPYPDLYHATLECLGIGADEAIALEDSPSGATAAVAAGVFCVVVPNRMTRGLAFPEGCLRLESLAELPLEALLRRLELTVG